MDSSRMGDTQRPVVPITPSLTIPETSVCSALTSNEIDSSSVWTRRAVQLLELLLRLVRQFVCQLKILTVLALAWLYGLRCLTEQYAVIEPLR